MKSPFAVLFLTALAAAPAAALEVRMLSVFQDAKEGQALEAVAEGGPEEGLREAAKSKRAWLRQLGQERLIEHYMSSGEARKADEHVRKRGNEPRLGPAFTNHEYALLLRGLLKGEPVPEARQEPGEALLEGVWWSRRSEWQKAAAAFMVADDLEGDLGARARISGRIAALHAGTQSSPLHSALFSHKDLGILARLVEAASIVEAEPQRAKDLAGEVRGDNPLAPHADFIGALALQVGGKDHEARAGFAEILAPGTPAAVRVAAAGRIFTLARPSDPEWREAQAAAASDAAPSQLPWLLYLEGKGAAGSPEAAAAFIKAASIGVGTQRSASLFEALRSAAPEDASTRASALKLLGKPQDGLRDPFQPWSTILAARHYIESREPEQAGSLLRGLLDSGRVGLGDVALRATALDTWVEAQVLGGDPASAYAILKSSCLPLWVEQPIVRDFTRNARVVMSSLEGDPLARARLLEEAWAENPDSGCPFLLSAAAGRLTAGDIPGATEVLSWPAGSYPSKGWKEILHAETLFRDGGFDEAHAAAGKAFAFAEPCSTPWLWAGKLALSAAFSSEGRAGAGAFVGTAKSLIAGCPGKEMLGREAAKDLMLGPIYSAVVSSGPLAGPALDILRFAWNRADQVGPAAAEAFGRAHYQWGNIQKAADLLGRAASPDARALLGRALSALGRHKEAEAIFKALLEGRKGEVSHDTLSWRTGLALSLAGLGDPDAADRELRRVVQDSSAAPQFRQELAVASQALGELQRRLGRPDEALGFFELARNDANPDSRTAVPAGAIRAASLAGDSDGVSRACALLQSPGVDDRLRCLEALGGTDPRLAGQSIKDLIESGAVRDAVQQRLWRIKAQDFLREGEQDGPQGPDVGAGH